MGVQGWITYKNTTDFITDRMNVSVTEYVSSSSTNKYIDFSTGVELDDYVEPTTTEWIAAFETYLALCEEYEDLMLPGYFDFPQNDIPEDLTMLFKDFVAKYNISAAVPKLFELTGMGVGDIMNTVTLFVMQATGAPFVSVFVGNGTSIVPTSGDVHELYDRISDFLGDNVLYNTTVVSSIRGANDSGVQLITQDVDGRQTQIKAKRLLLAIEPTEENMKPFDLDETESEVFEKFQQSNLYVVRLLSFGRVRSSLVEADNVNTYLQGLVKSPSLPVNVSLTNMPTSAEPSNWTDLPLPSFNTGFDFFSNIGDLFRFTVVGTRDLDVDGAQELVVDGFDNLVQSGVLGPTNSSSLEFVAFENHGAMHLRVSSNDLEAGFIQDLYALQGRRSTWYTGAAFSAQWSTILWAYNDILLPKVVEGIE